MSSSVFFFQTSQSAFFSSNGQCAAAATTAFAQPVRASQNRQLLDKISVKRGENSENDNADVVH
jgi:hypothetical protein